MGAPPGDLFKQLGELGFRHAPELLREQSPSRPRRFFRLLVTCPTTPFSSRRNHTQLCLDVLAAEEPPVLLVETGGRPVRGLQDGLRSRPRAGRQHHECGAPRQRHRRADPVFSPTAGAVLDRPAVDLECAADAQAVCWKTSTYIFRGLAGPQGRINRLSDEFLQHHLPDDVTARGGAAGGAVIRRGVSGSVTRPPWPNGFPDASL